MLGHTFLKKPKYPIKDNNLKFVVCIKHDYDDGIENPISYYDLWQVRDTDGKYIINGDGHHMEEFTIEDFFLEWCYGLLI